MSGLDQCLTGIYHYSVRPRTFTAPNSLCAPPAHLSFWHDQLLQPRGNCSSLKSLWWPAPVFLAHSCQDPDSSNPSSLTGPCSLLVLLHFHCSSRVLNVLLSLYWMSWTSLARTPDSHLFCCVTLTTLQSWFSPARLCPLCAFIQSAEQDWIEKSNLAD